YEQIILKLSEAQILDTAMDNGSSFKDLLAHLSCWERIELYWLESTLEGKQPERYYPGFEVGEHDPEGVINLLNSRIYQKFKDAPLEKVLEDFRSTHLRLVALVESLSEDMLNNPLAFSWWRGEAVMTSIAHNSYQHFHEHLNAVRSWLKQALGTPSVP
ncbi:MAG TPA: ClbS/DfsB family four-helix bundle protein, partial [Anaerolineales bacterium]|nr:ClbS/DfsB family four-helix bundle protein [Anaerolineales bacterium]